MLQAHMPKLSTMTQYGEPLIDTNDNIFSNNKIIELSGEELKAISCASNYYIQIPLVRDIIHFHDCSLTKDYFHHLIFLSTG